MELFKTKADSKNSWTIEISDINQETFDLSVKNPNKKDRTVLRDPEDIINEMNKLDSEIKGSILSIKKLL